MPNWCENFARIEVPNKEEATILETILNDDREEYEQLRLHNPSLPDMKDDLGIFKYLYPEPEYEEVTGPNKTFPDWYSWRVNHWGTKWDVDVQHFDIQENTDGTYTFELNFDSAWSPPIGVYEIVSQREGWDVFATYIEGGMSFHGYFEDGEDYYYELGSRDTSEAPGWLKDDHAWYYDQQEEWEMEEDCDLVVKGEMTEDEFIVKWGIENYNQWSDLMTPGTGDPTKKEVNNA